ncbi:PulL Type II secretory pathway, component PulL [Oxalobacteraceae bacterium]
MPITKANDTLYLRLPARTGPSNATDTTNTIHVGDPAGTQGTSAIQTIPLALALAIRGRPLRTATASLSELAPQVTQVSQVVLLLAASDVTLLRIVVPPLSVTRLRAALPSLIEEFVIGDTAECAIAAGAEADGQRLIAVCDRAWLKNWIDALRQSGARRIHVLPISLCLPSPNSHLSAALFQYAHRYQLALRLSDHEGIGLAVDVDDEIQLPNAVARLIVTLAGNHPVSLSVPAAQVALFEKWIDEEQLSQITLTEQQWSDWIAASAKVSVDLISAFEGNQRAAFPWREWRWPIALAAAASLVNIAAINADWWRLRSEGQQLRDEITDIYRRSFPNETVVLDPLAQIKQKIAASRQASGQLNTSDFVVLAAALGEVWREAGNDLRAIDALDYRDGTLTIKLKKTAQVSLAAMRSLLATRELQLTPSPTDPLLWQVKPL